MIEQRVYDYFITQDYNCAESTLHAANDEYAMNLKKDDFKLISAFGAGMGCEKTCGALCGALAAIGYLKVTGRAHITENFSDICGNFVQKFEKDLGSINCDVLKAKYRNEETRCLKTVTLAVNALDGYLKQLDA